MINDLNHNKLGQRGSALLGALIIAAVGMMLLAGTLSFISSTARTSKVRSNRSEDYYEAEQSFNLAVSWMRSNSANLISPFLKDNFDITFQQNIPNVGPNDLSAFTVTTRAKLSDGNTAVLTNDDLLVTPAFPETKNINNKTTFNPVSEFAQSYLGSALVRVTLLDAVPEQLGADFNPIFRIDAMTGIFEGAHIYGYLVGKLVNSGSAFFGRDQFQSYSNCDSYESNKGAYSNQNRKANCYVTSQGSVAIRKDHFVYGSVRTSGSVASGKNWSGMVCADFEQGCPVPGNICEGVQCQVPDLPVLDEWENYCPIDQDNLTVTKDTVLTVKSADPGDKCWGTITVKNKAVLTLHTVTVPYFIDTLNIKKGSKVELVPDGNEEIIELFVKKFGSNRFDGLEVSNAGNKPYQLQIYYNGKSKLTLDGTADMFLFLTSPFADVSMSGSYDFFGGIKAEKLNVGKEVELHFDESGGLSTPTDIDFTVEGVSQRYR